MTETREAVVAKKKAAVSPKDQAWIEARRRHRLSHAHVQMARELGFNPKKLGSLDNHRQQPWKLPLRQYIEHLYLKRFGRERPEAVTSIEERSRQVQRKKAERKAARATRVPVSPVATGKPDHLGT